MKTFGPKSVTQNLQVEIENTPAVTVDSGSIDGYVQGTTADGAAFTDNPVGVGGVYLDDPTASTLADGEIGNVLVNDQRMQITEDRVYDAPTDANKTVPVFIPQDRYDTFDLSGTRATSDATFSYYVSLQGYNGFSLQYIPSGDGYKTLTVYASNENVDDPTSATYTDVTLDFFGQTSFITENWLERDTNCTLVWLKIQVAATSLGVGLTAAWDLFGKKKSA